MEDEGGNLYIDFLKEVNTKGMSQAERRKTYHRWKKQKGLVPLPEVPPSVRNAPRARRRMKPLPPIPTQVSTIGANADLSNFLSYIMDEYLMDKYDEGLPKELIPYYNMLKGQFELIK